MLNLSIRSQLGLYVLVELARADGAQRSNEELATSLDVSVNHLAKVMQSLARVGWVQGSRGAGGGYRLVVDPKSIAMADVVAAFEGEPVLDDCDAGTCDKLGHCSVHKVFHEIEEQAYFTLKSVTVHMLAQPAG